MENADDFDGAASALTGTATVRGYEFTLSGGQVTAEQYLIGTHSFNLKPPTNASFAVDTGAATVTETLSGSKVIETLVYQADPLHAGLYQIASETETVSSPVTTGAGGKVHGYTFTLSSSGTVTAMQAVNGSHSVKLGLQPNTQFNVNSAGHSVTETLSQGNQLETMRFVSSDGSTYALASDAISFVNPGTAATALWIAPYERDKFSIDSSGAVTQVQAVRANGTLLTLTPGSGVSYTQLAPGYVSETVSSGGVSHYEVYHDGNGDGIYTEVAHGQGTSIDLVGLKAQISAAIDATL